MKRFGIGLVIACATVLAPAVASAALALRFDGGNGPLSGPTIPGPGPYFVDLVLVETGTPDNEGLFAYDLGLVTTAGGPVRFTGAQKPDNWVFTAPDATFTPAEVTANRVIINAVSTLQSGPDQLINITTGAKAARIHYTIDCDTATTPISRVSLDPNITVFGSGDPNHELEIAVDDSDGRTFVCPEPAALALLPLGGLLALRRRRR